MTDDKPLPPMGSPDGPPGTAPANTNIAPGTPSAAPTLPGAISAEPLAVPPIPLTTPPATRPSAHTLPPKKEADTKDTFRELIETVVFVVVLVLMLKTFLAEAFVIPTGSMATTLFGYHYKVTCKECGYLNFVNASSEADPQGGFPQPVVSCQCQNCGFTNVLRELPKHPGERP